MAIARSPCFWPFLAVVVGCSAGPRSTPGADDILAPSSLSGELAGIVWRLADLDGASIASNRAPVLVFTKQGFVARDRCDSGGGSYSVRGEWIIPESFGWLLDGCGARPRIGFVGHPFRVQVERRRLRVHGTDAPGTPVSALYVCDLCEDVRTSPLAASRFRLVESSLVSNARALEAELQLDADRGFSLEIGCIDARARRCWQSSGVWGLGAAPGSVGFHGLGGGGNDWHGIGHAVAASIGSASSFRVTKGELELVATGGARAGRHRFERK